MIRINLLPPEQRLPKWRKKRIYVTITLVLFFSFFFVYACNEAIIYYTEQKLQDSRSQLADLSITREKIAEATARQQAIEQKAGVLNNLMREKTSSYPPLVQLGSKLPPEIWLTGLELNKDVFKINGMAKGYADLVSFLQKLEKDDVFTEPVLIRSEKDADSAATKFEMTVKIRGM